MNQQLAERRIQSWICNRRTGQNIPHLVKQAYSYMQRVDQAKTPTTLREQYEFTLKARDRIMESGEGYRRRAAARKDLANYINGRVLPAHFDMQLSIEAGKLENARPKGTWGMRPDGSTVTIWDDKSGLVRLDPDEAREESKRVAERYVTALQKLGDDGHGLHYMVLTIPNVARGELAKAKTDLFKRWVNFNRMQRAKHALFPEILGSLVVMEDPLSRHRDWNVHLNVIMVTEKKFHDGLYEKIRREWKFNVEIRPLGSGSASLSQACAELIKYSARAVPDKSEEKSRRHKTEAPAMTEWTPDEFYEWWRAQRPKNRCFRRTRSYGILYGNKVPKPEPRGIEDITWLGSIRCNAYEFFAELPLIDLIPGDKSTTRAPSNYPTGPP